MNPLSFPSRLLLVITLQWIAIGIDGLPGKMTISGT